MEVSNRNLVTGQPVLTVFQSLVKECNESGEGFLELFLSSFREILLDANDCVELSNVIISKVSNSISLPSISVVLRVVSKVLTNKSEDGD